MSDKMMKDANLSPMNTGDAYSPTNSLKKSYILNPKMHRSSFNNT